MKQKNRTYWKAFFLLLVFSLNTIVSFACSLGGVFHQFHHQSVISIHEHKGGHGHDHDRSMGHTLRHRHSGNEGHKHLHAIKHDHRHISTNGQQSGDDCCSGSIVKLEKADKATTSVNKIPVPALEKVFLGTLTFYFAQVQVPRTTLSRFYRWRPPGTIQDLRIAIQSFQI
ncbi:MAG: hypothetical protein EOO16_01450 [Chitinophagaceae bacterium]|nr:MAG: hypothetical protein EOO16_01450 [Chitinophagaceae bacterium]